MRRRRYLSGFKTVTRNASWLTQPTQGYYQSIAHLVTIGGLETTVIQNLRRNFPIVHALKDAATIRGKYVRHLSVVSRACRSRRHTGWSNLRSTIRSLLHRSVRGPI